MGVGPAGREAWEWAMRAERAAALDVSEGAGPLRDRAIRGGRGKWGRGQWLSWAHGRRVVRTGSPSVERGSGLLAAGLDWAGILG